jgi:RecA/RadA recombinase
MAIDGKSAAEFEGYVDTGSYAMNAALSGTIYGGIPNNKQLVLAGESTTGKTFFTLCIIKHFLETDKKARVFYFDTESAVTNKMFEDFGIDVSRVAKSEPESIERFRTVALRVLDAYEKDKSFPLMMVLDSLSMLPSVKETTDVRDGKDVRDMTKAQLLKGAFRVLRLKMGKVGVPMIITNHVYDVVGAYVPTKAIGGGSGAKYAADSIAMLTKSKERADDKSVIGNVIHVTMQKSRLSRENTKVDTRIMYSGGLDRYYGLLPIAESGGVVKKVSNKYEFPDGQKAFEKAILKNPEKFFTKDVLDAIDAVVQKQFKYLPGEPAVEDDDDGEGEE